MIDNLKITNNTISAAQDLKLTIEFTKVRKEIAKEIVNLCSYFWEICGKNPTSKNSIKDSNNCND